MIFDWSLHAEDFCFPRFGAFLEPCLDLQHGNGLVVRAIDAFDFIVALRQLPSFFERLFLRREFARNHLVLQFIIDIADKPSHQRVSLVPANATIALNIRRTKPLHSLARDPT